VPWIFVYRNPVEVMVSQLNGPGVQMIRGSIDRLLPGLHPVEALQMPAEEYCGRVLERFCSTALARLGKGNGIAVEYTELPGAVTGRIADHFGISFSRTEIEKMNAASKFDAKTRGLDFTPDGEAKRKKASDEMRQVAAERLDPLYERLRASV
jgi:hypothetical protein